MGESGRIEAAIPTRTDVQERNEQEWLAELLLTAGPIVRFRHVRPEDEPLITEAIRTASGETLLHRFFSPIRSVSRDMLRRMLSIDRTNETCVVGVTGEAIAERIICGARYVKLSRAGAAEIALTVHDEFQHRGLGTFLLRLLASLAVADGIHQFEADVLASNQNMLNLFRKVAPGKMTSYQLGDVYHIVIQL